MTPSRDDSDGLGTPAAAATPGAAAARLAPEGRADLLAAAVLACPFVVALSGGRAGEVATYLPGRQVAGVRLTDAGVQVNVIAAYGPTCGQVAEQVRAAVHAITGAVPVAVGIDDLDLTRPAPPA